MNKRLLPLAAALLAACSQSPQPASDAPSPTVTSASSTSVTATSVFEPKMPADLIQKAKNAAAVANAKEREEEKTSEPAQDQ